MSKEPYRPLNLSCVYYAFDKMFKMHIFKNNSSGQISYAENTYALKSKKYWFCFVKRFLLEKNVGMIES